MRVRPRAWVIMRCSSEAVKNLWEAMSKVCTACIYTRAVFFHVFPKIKMGMAAVSSTATPLRVYMPRIYSAVILVLAINLLKMKQGFFLFCSSRAVAR